ncbi:MAG: hypothetical protein ACXWT3_02570 [Methylococcaceae bacterium]
MMLRIKGVIAALLIGCFASAAATAASFGYLYIEASEGDSSGGHSAIQFDDQIYHYQYVDPGLIRLFKQDKNDFHFSYRYLQNRPIHLSRIEVSEETLNLLKDYFQQHFFEQEQQFKELEALYKDQLFIQQLLHNKTADEAFINTDATAVLQLNGVGLFYPEQGLERPITNINLKAQQSNSINQLRNKIEQHYGSGYLLKTRQNIETQIKALQPVNWPSIYSPSPEKLPGPIYSFTDKYSDYLTGLYALKVILEGQPLQSDAFVVMNQNAFEISAAEREILLKLRNQLETSLLQSFSSGRPDWGYAVLLNIARFFAVDASLQLNRWVFTDDFSGDSKWISADEYNQHKEQMQILLNDARTDLDRIRQTATKTEILMEVDYSQLELTANRYAELLKGEQQTAIRFDGQKPLPGKSIGFPNEPIPDVSQQQLTAALTELKNYESRLLRQLEHNYQYDLIRRNCVTEIFRTIDHALGQQIKHDAQLSEPDALLTEASKERLGGYVSIPYNFIPFVSYQSVQNHYNVTHSEELASYRNLKIAQLNTQENKLLVSLRESNILSSTLYSYNPDDALFIFFTDDSFLLRPFFGLINTSAGIGQSLLGFFSWPFDSGKNLKSGATGVLMSLPELFFVNMRKGSYKYLSNNQAALPK